MPELIFHPDTARAIDRLLQQPPHALLLVAPAGGGKTAAAEYITARLLELTPAGLATHAYFARMSAADGIDAVRELQHFARLKVPGQARNISRVALIEHAEKLGAEAQNALLKLLEEPPLGMVLLLTTDQEQAVLPTYSIALPGHGALAPPREALAAHFAASQPVTTALIDQALAMTGGLPGAAHAILTGDADQPATLAAGQARAILQADSFDRLVIADSLSKQREVAVLTVAMLARMSEAALQKLGQQADTDSIELRRRAERWQHILELAASAREKLLANGQTKLILTDLMLAL